MPEAVKCGCVLKLIAHGDGEEYEVDASACIVPAAVETIRAELDRIHLIFVATPNIDVASSLANQSHGLEFALRALGVEVANAE